MVKIILCVSVMAAVSERASQDEPGLFFQQSDLAEGRTLSSGDEDHRLFKPFAEGHDEFHEKRSKPATPNFDGYVATQPGWRCIQNADYPLAHLGKDIENYSPDVQRDQEEHLVRTLWNQFWNDEERKAKAGKLLKDEYGQDLSKEEDGTLDLTDDWEGYRHRYGEGSSQFLTLGDETLNWQQSGAVCFKDKMEPKQCKRVCDLIPECEAFGTFNTLDTYSTCCLNNLPAESDDPSKVHTWAEKIDDVKDISETNPNENGNWHCHRKAPPVPAPAPDCMKIIEAGDKTHPGWEECQVVGKACEVWSDDERLFEGEKKNQHLIDELKFVEEDYYGNCRAIDSETNQWKMAAFASGMSDHLLNTSVEEQLKEDGILHGAKDSEWAEAAKRIWTVEGLKNQTWTLQAFQNLETTSKPRPGCVRNITYEGCKKEAVRLQELGKIDAFDFLWGKYNRTAEYQKHLDDCEKKHGSNRKARLECNQEFEGEKFPLDLDGRKHVTHAHTDIFGIVNYQELPADLDSACCLFKTPENHKMKGAHTSAKSWLWQRKCTVCLRSKED